MSELAAMAKLLADDLTDLGQLPRAQVLATLAVAEELEQLTKFLRSGATSQGGSQVLATLAVAEELEQLTKFLRSGKLMVDTDRA